MIRALDTNIVVRMLAEPQSPQYPAALRAMDEPFVLPPSVVLEAEWVLRSVFRWRRDDIAAALGALLDLPACGSDTPKLRWLLDRFAAGADFADLIHLLLAQDADCFLTFDASLARAAGADAPLPIETLR